MLYVFNPDEELIALLKPDYTRSTGPTTSAQAFLSAEFPAEFDREPTAGCSYWDAVHREVLNGENTFSFTVPGGQADAAYVTEGNLVAFKDLDSYWQVFEIKRLVDTHSDGLTRTAYCEHIFYELLDDIVTDKRPSAGATAALAGMLENTRWQVGIVDDLGASSTSAYYESALSAVQKVANAWHGELNWRCVISGGVITRYVDLLAMRGTDTGKQFAYAKDILTVEREVDSSGIVTALYGRGKGVETDSGSYGRRLTFADVVAADKPSGQEWVGDSAALAQWGRNGRHRFDVFTDEEETDPAKLLQKTRDELARRKVPRATYRLDVVSLEQLTGYEHEKVRLGDLVRVIDREFTPELVVSARVIEIERDILDPANTKVVLGSFAPTIVEATINTARRVNEMANRPFNTKWLDGKISVLQNEIENTTSFVFQNEDDGILILDAADYATATKAMKLGGGIFAIANQKDGVGGWNWRTFGDGSGFSADLITAGIIDAGLVQIGPQTTFAPGYDPTKGSMGVDSDCVGLWHFDGSLNSHKGVTAIGDENFDTGCFGQAVRVEEGTTNLLTANQASAETDTTGFEVVGDATISRDTAEHWDGLASLKVVTTATQWTGVSTVKQAATAGTTYTASVYVKGSGTVVLSLRAWDDTPTFIGQQQSASVTLTGTWQRVTVTYAIPSGATKMDIAILTDTANAITFYVDGLQLEEKAYYATTFVIGTRLGVLKIPTAGMSASEGTITFRAYNLAASANGSVLVDLPKSDNTQGLLCGISSVAGHEGEAYITDSTSTAYGPNKSTLTAWDSISLAWKSDRLSLVVNDTEACYIENPGLPPALGDYLFIGTDRNGANAINTLVDELRIDKVYREVNIRTGWHKTGVPFYTSEDMKQWPGYLRAETDGLKVYDSNDALRVLLGSWLKDAVRKYGIKIIEGEMYSGIIRTGGESDTTYIQLISPNLLQVFSGGKKQMEIDTEVGGRIQFFNDGTYTGDVRGTGDGKVFIYSTGKIWLLGQTGVDVQYGINVSGGTKNCIEDTIYGKLAISARESPEVRYVDEGMGTLTNGACRVDVDPIFMECIEPHTPDSRWYIQLTPYADVDLYVSEIGDGYFVVKERKGGTTTGAEFTWSLSATRKDYAMIRFMEVFD